MVLIAVNLCMVGHMVGVLFYIEHHFLLPLQSPSNRFCALKLQDKSGFSVLLINVYMPSSCQPSFLCNYLDILGAIEGFVDSHQCDVIVIVGDF